MHEAPPTAPPPAARAARRRGADPFHGRRVLVTGASGFLGAHLCRRLAAAAVETWAVSRTLPRAASGSMRNVPGDLTDLDATRELLRECRPDVVFHLAGLAAGAPDPELVLPTFRSNLVTTVNLLTALREQGASRIVLAGSMEEPDEADAAPGSPYAASKSGSSAYGRMFHRLYGLPIAIARIFVAYGPTARDLHKLVPRVILSLLDGRSPRLGSGRREVDWIHVDDVVGGLLAMAAAPQAVGRTLDLGSGTLVPIRELAERIAELVDGRGAAPVFDPALDRPSERVRVADLAATRGCIAWQPATDLNQGLAATVEWFREHRALIRADGAGRVPDAWFVTLCNLAFQFGSHGAVAAGIV